MHQTRFRLGLRLRPRSGILQRFPRSPSSWIKGGPTSKGSGGQERGKEEKKKGEGRREKGRRRKGGERGEKKKGSGPKGFSEMTPLKI